MSDFVKLITSDQIKISAILHPCKYLKTNSCMIVAPGFACHSQATVMLKICDSISQHVDVLCLDFRGNGESEGGYYFGGKEYLDLFPAFQWAEAKYEKVFLLGFSLGAYSSLRAVTFFRPKLQHLFLVSCPTKVDDVFWSGAAFKQTYDQVFRKKALGKERHLFFKWRNPFNAKPSALEFAPLLNIPVSFLVGEKDLLVPISMTEKVFEVIQNVKKSWLEIPQGAHADELFMSNSEATEKWLLSGLEL